MCPSAFLPFPSCFLQKQCRHHQEKSTKVSSGPTLRCPMLIRRDRRSRSVRTVNMLCFVGVTCFNTEQCCYLLQVFCNVCKWASTAHATRMQQHLNACLHPTPGMAGLLEVESSDSQPDQGLSHGQSSLTASSLADSQNDSHVGLENGPPGPAAVKDESSSQTTPKGSKGVLFSRMFLTLFLVV